LLTGRNFGCGSSREHAAWALQDYGFEAVIGPSFGDIFAANSAQIGLVLIVLPEEEVQQLMEARTLTIDLEAQTVTDQFGRTVEFPFDAFRRRMLLNGLDDIGLTLEHEDAISAFEAAGPSPVDTSALPA
jgi:3-isopropylmalate/(R)-2-methylmalate dehydratase small subunit